MITPPPGAWERRAPDNVIVTDSKCRAISSEDPRIPYRSHYAPFLGPDNSRLISSVLPHITEGKPAFINLSRYRIDSDTEVPAAELHIIKNSYGGYICMFWRKQIEQITAKPVKSDEYNIVSSSQNSFIVTHRGVITAVTHPERTAGNAIGVNIYDAIWPEYHHEIQTGIDTVLQTHKPVDIEYVFSLNGETRHKIGYISPAGESSVVFNVRRITQEELQDRTG